MECANVFNGASHGPFSELLSGTLTTLMAASCLIVDPGQWPQDRAEFLLNNGIQEYDFIVVGAGSAGSVVASRLSEVPQWKVLLIEAGGDPPIESQVPGLFFSNLKTAIDWEYKIEKSPNACLGMKDQQCRWPRGKTLGGSSAINAMIYIRGHPHDYDSWEEMGNPGWGYDDVLPYFKKSEHIEDEKIRNIKKTEHYHGEGGYLNIGSYNGSMEMSQTIIDAQAELGYRITEDFNGEDLVGAGRYQGSVKNGIRHSSAKAFLQPARNRENLHVVKNAIVTEIIIDEFTKEATGVVLNMNDKQVTVKVKREIVVSAGAINSPQLLMLSGIGPQDHLQDLGIQVVSDLPVGDNLQDHLMTPVFYKIKKTEPPTVNIVKELIDYITERKGLFSSIGTLDIGGFFNTDENSSYPDTQYHFNTMLANTPQLVDFGEKNGFDDEFSQMYRNLNTDADVIHIFSINLKPKSKGKILLKNKYPMEKPLIYANYLDHDDDIKTMLRGIRLAERMEDTRAFKKIGAKLAKMDYTPCNGYEFRSDEYWICVMKYVASTLYHPVGTVKMGPSDDKTAVVDATLKVYGVKKLRVADASIMPDIIRGNTNAPSIMIGEKAADMIKKDYL